MNEETHPIPDEGIAREYEMVAEAESNAPPQMLAAIGEWDDRVAREELAPERDRELEVETHFA